MNRRFVVLVDKPTPQQVQALSSIFRDRYAWWHWIAGAWLVTDATGVLTASGIRDRISQVAPGLRNLVIEVAHKSWAGFGPTASERNMFDWIRGNWE